MSARALDDAPQALLHEPEVKVSRAGRGPLHGGRHILDPDERLHHRQSRPVGGSERWKVQFDVRGKGEPFLFIKGFWKCGPQDLHAMGKKMFFKPFKPGPSFSLMAMGTSGEEKRDAHPGDYIQNYRRRLVARIDNPNEWRRFKTVIRLEAERRIEVVLLELYAFWPPGDFFFDNVRMTRVTKAEADAAEHHH